MATRLRSVSLHLWLMAGAAGLCACAHPEPLKPAFTEAQAARRLHLLERHFLAFIDRSLLEDAGGAKLPPVVALAQMDHHMAELERLRARYLDLVTRAPPSWTRSVALMRLGELHLDFCARLRRLPYPDDMPRDARARFDAELSRLALPLEAIGLGLMAQLQDTPSPDSSTWRFVRRANLYEALHGRARHLNEEQLHILRQELSDPRPYAAPRRLLANGRIGQRASR